MTDEPIDYIRPQPVNTGPIDAGTPPLDRPENIDTLALTGETEPDMLAVRADLSASASAGLNEQLASAVEPSDIDPAEVAAQVEQTIQNNDDLQVNNPMNSDLYIEDGVFANNVGYVQQSLTISRNLQILREEILRGRGEYDDRWGITGVMNWIDYNLLRGITIGMYEGMTNRTSRQGELVANLLANSDPIEARAQIRAMIDAASEEGIFMGGEQGINQFEREAYSWAFNPDLAMDRTFAALDIIGWGTTGLARRAAMGALRGTTRLWGITPSTRAGALGGRQAANQTAENIIRASDDPDTLTDIAGGLARPETGSIQPGHAVIQRVDEDSILRETFELEQRGTIQTLDKDELLSRQGQSFRSSADETIPQRIRERIDEFKAIVGRRFIDVTPRVVTTDAAGELVENATLVARFGTQNGRGFRSEAAAQNMAEQYGGRVAKDADGTFVVEVESTVFDESALRRELNNAVEDRGQWAITRAIQRVTGNFFNRFYSTSARDVVELAQDALRAQGAERALVVRTAKRLEEFRSLVSAAEMNTMNEVLDVLRAMPKSKQLEWSEELFKHEWRQLAGEFPSENVVKAQRIIRDLNDAAYVTQARITLQRVLRNGYTQAVNIGQNFRTAVKRVARETVDNDALVYNGRTGEIVRKGTIKDDVPFFRLNDDYKSGSLTARYTIYPEDLGPVRSSDVLGYAAYGRRTNPLVRNFVMSIDSTGSMKALVGARTSKEAAKAVEELGAIRKAIDDFRNNRLTAKQLDDVFARNSTWRPDVQDFASFQKWATKQGVDIDQFVKNEVFDRPRDARVTVNESGFHALGENTVGEHVNYQMSRSDYVLSDFGGGEVFNPNPLESIVRQVSNTQKAWAFNYYTHRAAIGWMEQAERLVPNILKVPDDIPANDVIRRFEKAEIPGNSEFARQFREAQRIFATRRFRGTKADQALESFFDSALETLNDIPAFRNVDASFKSIPRRMMTFAYYKSFWGDLSQIYLQGSGILSSVSLARHGVGLRGAVTQRTMRKVMALAKDSAEERELLERLGKELDLSLDDMQDLASIWRDFNPHIVLGDIMEMGSGLGLQNLGRTAARGVKETQESFARRASRATQESAAGQLTGRALRQARDIGMKPFNWGESNARATGFQIAALEFKKEFPNLRLTSDAGRRYVSRRAEELTLDMSNTSKATIQQGVMGVPTQFLTHFFRVQEKVFFGRDLTFAERGRLFAVIAPLYGVTGLPVANSVADVIFEQLGLDPNNETHRNMFIGIKYGLFDFMTASLLDVETAMAVRMSVFTQYSQLYDTLIVERDYAAVLGGPSGSMIGTTIDVVADAIRGLSVNHGSLWTEDAINMLRQMKGPRNVIDAIGVFNEGVIRNTRGQLLDLTLDPLDAVTVFLGFSPLEKQEYYELLTADREQREETRQERAFIQRQAQRAWENMGDDPVSSAEILRNLSTYIDALNVPQSVKRRLRDAITYRSDERRDRAIANLWENGRTPYSVLLQRHLTEGTF